MGQRPADARSRAVLGPGLAQPIVEHPDPHLPGALRLDELDVDVQHVALAAHAAPHQVAHRQIAADRLRIALCILDGARGPDVGLEPARCAPHPRCDLVCQGGKGGVVVVAQRLDREDGEGRHRHHGECRGRPGPRVLPNQPAAAGQHGDQQTGRDQGRLPLGCGAAAASDRPFSRLASACGFASGAAPSETSATNR